MAVDDLGFVTTAIVKSNKPIKGKKITYKPDDYAGYRVKPLSAKAVNSILNTAFLNVWEGAVRSGKTVASTLAWYLYVSASPDSQFIMTGNTIGSLYRNVIGGDFGLLAILGKKARYKTDTNGNKVLIITGARGDAKTCFCFGAHDSAAYQAIRGVTAGGCYADEVNLQDPAVISECFNRTIASHDRKYFWTLNPSNPNHWIYTDYLDLYAHEPPKGGFFLWHFLLDDNLALTEERKDELKSQYRGMYYRRYILGERCMAEGIIYDMITSANFYRTDSRPYALEKHADRYIAVDYGTTNPCVFLEIFDDGERIWVDREKRWDSKTEQAQKTDAQYADDMDDLQDDRGYGRCPIIIDPSAASFAAELQNRGYITIAGNNDVINGIRHTSTLLAHGKIKINRDHCAGLISELSAYMWDSKAAEAGEERPVKMLDHAPDALRYYCYTMVAAWRTGKVSGADEDTGEE